MKASRNTEPPYGDMLCADAAGVNVLLAEDDDDARLALADDLQQCGYDVDVAGCGDELVQILGAYEERDRRPDVIITDLCMPGYSGMQVLEGLNEAGWQTPLILMTAFGGDAIRNDALERGAIGYLEKPFDTTELLVLLRSLAQSGSA